MKKYLLILALLLLSVFPRVVVAEGFVLINEFIIHPDSGVKEWVEFYNPDGADLETYWIDDDDVFSSDAGSSPKRSLQGLVQNSDTEFPYIELPSSIFNNSGDMVVLFDEDGTIVDEYEYSDDPGTDVTVGRVPDGGDEFQILVESTKGSPNSEADNDVSLSPSEPVCYDPEYVHSLRATIAVLQTPKPTKTPTPTQTPTPTSTPVPTQLPTPVYMSGSVASTKDIRELKNRFAPVTPYPDQVLGISTKAAEKIGSKAAMSQKEVIVKAKSYTNSSMFFILAGSLLMGCGILLFFMRKKEFSI